MPIVTIIGNANMDIDKKREMVKKVSEIVAEAHDLPISSMSVLIQGTNEENVAYGGKLISDFGKAELTAMQKKKMIEK